jgi:hypothetical protein
MHSGRYRHRNALLSRVQIHSYNQHLGLLWSELCTVNTGTVYSVRREADFVMSSDVVSIAHSNGVMPLFFKSPSEHFAVAA